MLLPARPYGSTTHDHFQCTVMESSLTSSESSSSSSMKEHLISNLVCIDSGLIERSTLSENGETSDSEKCFSGGKELVPCLSSASSGLNRTISRRTYNLESTSPRLLNLEPSSTHTDSIFVPVVEADDSMNDSFSPSSSVRFLSGISQLAPENMPANGNLTSEIDEASSSSSSDQSVVSSSLNLLPEEPISEATLSGVGFLRVEDMIHGSVPNVDVVSISSNIIPDGTGDRNSNEARRNSRRLFWDAFSRRGARRNHASLMLSSTDDNDNLGSQDRWLLDVEDDLFGSRFDQDSMYLHRRGYGSNGQRWHSRSETRERLRFGFDNDRRQTTFCPSGIHTDGRCSCDSLFRHEESSTRASISRIVMLAEALFEVLDEIHRHPVSLSLSTVSLPAPESVVDSLPVKNHIKHDATRTSDDIEQCYICLAEYEEGDKIRILPCRHEYHMLCVDKWLKEIHGVCPLCRGDVCEGNAEAGV